MDSAQSIRSCAADSQIKQSFRISQINLFTFKRIFRFRGEISSFSRKKKHFNAHSILDKLIDSYNVSFGI